MFPVFIAKARFYIMSFGFVVIENKSKALLYALNNFFNAYKSLRSL